jgi:type II secretory pathway pseudopilin PulG
VTTLVSAGVLGVFIAGVVVTEVRAETEARANQDALRSLRFSLEDFYLDMTRYPRGREGLAQLVSEDPRGTGGRLDSWQGPYLQLDNRGLRFDRGTGRFVDPWENPILYWTEPDERWVYVASAGPDGILDSPGLGTLEFNGEVVGDDVVVWVEGP